MNTKHASITARIEALDSQYREARQIYETVNSRTAQDNALKAMTRITETADREGLRLPAVGLFDRMQLLQSTPFDLKQLTDNQLAYYQKSLPARMGTPDEQKARQLNRMIEDEKHRRSGYGD